MILARVVCGMLGMAFGLLAWVFLAATSNCIDIHLPYIWPFGLFTAAATAGALLLAFASVKQ